MDLWNLFPNEIVYQIFSYFGNITDVISLMKTCQRFRSIIKVSTKNLKSDKLCTVNILNFNGFHQLIKSNERCLLQIKKKTLPVLSTLNLHSANFYLGEFVALSDFEEIALGTLSALNLIEKCKIIARYNGRFIAIILEKGKLMFVGFFEKEHLCFRNLLNELSVLYPDITIYSSNDVLTGMILYHHKNISMIVIDEKAVLLGKMMKRFLQDGDFGLINPKQLPSKNNHRLSVYTSMLADIGLAYNSLLSMILCIYVKYHNLSYQGKIYPDLVLKEYFKISDELTYPQLYRDINKVSLLERDAPVSLLNKFNLNINYDSQKYNQIIKIVSLVYKIYRELTIQEGERYFYTVSGSKRILQRKKNEM